MKRLDSIKMHGATVKIKKRKKGRKKERKKENMYISQMLTAAEYSV